MRDKYLRSFMLVLLGSMSMILGAKIHVDLMGVPVSMQTFFLCLTALYFKPSEAVLVQVVYLVAGFYTPVFTHDYFGIDIFLGDTGGYLFGFIPAALLLSLYGKRPDFFGIFSYTVLAQALILLTGFLWLVTYREWDLDKALFEGVLVLLPGAFLKGGLAALIYFTGEKFIRKRYASKA